MCLMCECWEQLLFVVTSMIFSTLKSCFLLFSFTVIIWNGVIVYIVWIGGAVVCWHQPTLLMREWLIRIWSYHFAQLLRWFSTNTHQFRVSDYAMCMVWKSPHSAKLLGMLRLAVSCCTMCTFSTTPHPSVWWNRLNKHDGSIGREFDPTDPIVVYCCIAIGRSRQTRETYVDGAHSSGQAVGGTAGLGGWCVQSRLLRTRAGTTEACAESICDRVDNVPPCQHLPRRN